MKNKNLLKHKRNRQYEEITKEFSEAGLNLSEIKIEDFAESRKKEIFKFQEILNNKFSTKSGHQLLPKHMRRRQMSHNPFRIPRKNRLSNLTVNVKSKCIKHKRKLKNLKKSYIRRSINKNWLENHLWLSKRFVMKKLLNGYTIPYKRRDKGYRACYKYWEYESIISDISYYDYFIIKCQNIENFLNDIIENHIIELNMKFNKEFKCYDVNIYDKGNLIGPVKIWFYQNNVFFMNISFISQEIKNMLSNFNGIEFKFTHYLNAFIISGKKSLEKIFNIFKSCENENVKYKILSNKYIFKDYFEKCENGYMEVFKLNQPTSHFRMNELIFRNCLKDQENLNDDDNEISYTNKNIFIEDFLKIFIEHSKIPTDELLTSTDKSLIEFNHITERTTYMHRKKVDLNKLNSKLSESIKNKKNKENKIELIQTKKDYSKNKNTINLKSKDMTSNSEKQVFFCVIKKNIYYKEGNDIKYKELYIILFERGFCSDLFRRFVYLNTKAIGMKDLERYMTQYNQLNFPKDFPGTLTYKKYILDKAKRTISKYFKKPPSKRVNYQSILNPSPFYPSWNYINNQNIVKSLDYNFNNIISIPSINCLSNIEKLKKIIKITNKNDNNIILLCINFSVVERGVPKFNDLLCLPNEDDIDLYIKFKQNKNILNNNLFGEIQENDLIMDLNTFENIHHNFHLEEKINSSIKQDKNKNFNIELLSILDYYNSDCTKIIENKIINSDLTININTNTSRKIIGFVTTGLYDYSINKGKGIGYIQLNQYEQLINLKKKFNLTFIPLLIRGKNSKIYYLSQIDT